MTIPDDGRPCRLHGHPDPGDIRSQESAPIFAGEHTAGLDGFPAPAVKAKDPVGLGNGVPPLQIGQLPAVRLAGPDVVVGCSSQRPRQSIKYTERLEGAGIEPSVGSVGDSYDNALAETINGLYKAEVIHRRGPWRSFEAVEFATLEWVDWFTNRRLMEPVGNIPPAEAEARYYAMLEQPAMAA